MTNKYTFYNFFQTDNGLFSAISQTTLNFYHA